MLLNHCLMAIVVLAVASVWAVAISFPTASATWAHNFAHNRGPMKVQNIADDGGFPSNPSYGAVHIYFDTECAGLYIASSYLLDTCMTSDNTSVLYSCGKSNCRLRLQL
jgi:hypothetical protein